jgi:hypothetical protein
MRGHATRHHLAASLPGHLLAFLCRLRFCNHSHLLSNRVQPGRDGSDYCTTGQPHAIAKSIATTLTGIHVLLIVHLQIIRHFLPATLFRREGNQSLDRVPVMIKNGLEHKNGCYVICLTPGEVVVRNLVDGCIAAHLQGSIIEQSLGIDAGA